MSIVGLLLVKGSVETWFPPVRGEGTDIVSCSFSEFWPFYENP